MPLNIIYEDNHLIAVVKPAGVLTQSDASGNESLMDQVKNFIKERDQKPGKVFLGLLHRLDRNVSGIVLFAKTSKGASRLSEQFRDRTIKKTYTAIVEGAVMPASGTLRNYLYKDPAHSFPADLPAQAGRQQRGRAMNGASDNKRIALISDTPLPGYTEAELSYKVLRSNVNCSLLIVHLHTGRFHQIRAQFAHIGHPILGDMKYNSKHKLPTNDIALCATELCFRTATENKEVNLSIPYPKEWDRYL